MPIFQALSSPRCNPHTPIYSKEGRVGIQSIFPPSHRPGNGNPKARLCSGVPHPKRQSLIIADVIRIKTGGGRHTVARSADFGIPPWHPQPTSAQSAAPSAHCNAGPPGRSTWIRRLPNASPAQPVPQTRGSRPRSRTRRLASRRHRPKKRRKTRNTEINRAGQNPVAKELECASPAWRCPSFRRRRKTIIMCLDRRLFLGAFSPAGLNRDHPRCAVGGPWRLRDGVRDVIHPALHLSRPHPPAMKPGVCH